MTDEAYMFQQDIAEKKIKVRFPSDRLTKEELSAMNGECTTYRMNDPMEWKEFKKLPDDLKKVYIQKVRERFHAKSKDFCELFGCSHCTVDYEIKRLGLGIGTKMNSTPCDREAFRRWLNREQIEDSVENESESVASEAIDDDVPCAEKSENNASAASICGSMSFIGSAKGGA